MKIVSNITYEQAKKDFEETLAYYGKKPSSHLLYTNLDEARFHYKDRNPALFSNENNGYIKAKGIPKKASVFTIAGSYDSSLDLIGLGAKNVYSIDINSKQFYIDCLKLWSVYYLSYPEFFQFLVDPLSPRFLDPKIVDFILSQVPECPAKMYWYMIYERSGKDLLQDWFLMDEVKFKQHQSQRVIHCLYLKNQLLYDQVKQELEDAYIQFQVCDVMDISSLSLPPGIFDCALLSNVHNFIFPQDFYRVVIDKILPLVKETGWASYYEIERKPHWLSAIKRGEHPNISPKDFDSEHSYHVAITQVDMSLMLYKMFVSSGLDTTIYAVSTGGGIRRILTDKDSVVVINKTK